MGNALSLLAAIAAATVVIVGLLYVLVLTALGVRQSRRSGVAVARQEELIDAEPDLQADLHGLAFYALIAGLNEERVIGATISALLHQQPGVRVVVIDDGSTDRTAEIIDSFADTGLVTRLSRVAPNARQGKGEALNDGLRAVREDVAARGLHPANVIVVVMDADGWMTPNATAAAAGLFAADPGVGGLQLVVRIRNNESLMLAFQDMEFWAISGIGQLGRVRAGSVSMGGNGQFTRLRALDEVGERPWSRSLTEDLDLCVSLAVRGWRLTSTPSAYVTQQGVGELKRLLRQRTRWYQGHLSMVVRLPELARSRYLPTARFVELSAYVLMPWLVNLPWSLFQQYLLWQLVTGHALPWAATSSAGDRLLIAAAWYLISFAPNVFWGVVYFRRSRCTSLWRALLMTNLLLPWAYVAHLAVWRALGRMVIGRAGWTKTARAAESDSPLAGSPAESFADAVS